MQDENMNKFVGDGGEQEEETSRAALSECNSDSTQVCLPGRRRNEPADTNAINQNFQPDRIHYVIGKIWRAKVPERKFANIEKFMSEVRGYAILLH